VVIDALEFSAELRTVDVADELSFLAAECGLLFGSQVGYRAARTPQRVVA
jgi:aminoglycoside phosphotransferase family enzyme